jgi:Amt family ammonium transporter
LYGFIAAICFIFSSRLFEKWRIDDPVHAVSVHGVNGFLCLLLHGIFSNKTGILYAGNLKQMGTQIIGAFSLLIWSVLISAVFFYILKKYDKLRILTIYEMTGTDVLMSSGSSML